MTISVKICCKLYNSVIYLLLKINYLFLVHNKLNPSHLTYDFHTITSNYLQ